jgi:lipopolysaccharide/colanic/teichoic acid biosynthesis glycosyltransferase
MDGAADMNYWKRVRVPEVYDEICAQAGEEVAEFVVSNLDAGDLNTTPRFAYHGFDEHIAVLRDAPVFVDFRDSSQFDDLITHFSNINRMMADKGVYIGCFESKYNIQLRLFRKYNRVLSYLILMVHYMFRNFLPFWKHFSRKGKFLISSLYLDNSLAEVLGKQAYCGFEIINYKYHHNLTYFILRKKEPPKTSPVSTSRFIVRLNRIGKDGKTIRIYKIRTMYPFSEFIQDYVVKMNGYDTVGKPRNDFRLTRVGKVIRKLWLDELPQLFNLLRGDIRIVGVRPISRYGFSCLPQDLQEKRINGRPGLVPPHVALRLTGFAGVIKAERQYLEERERHGVRTDIKFFFLAIFNIVTFRVKSS